MEQLKSSWIQPSAFVGRHLISSSLSPCTPAKRVKRLIQHRPPPLKARAHELRLQMAKSVDGTAYYVGTFQTVTARIYRRRLVPFPSVLNRRLESQPTHRLQPQHHKITKIAILERSARALEGCIIQTMLTISLPQLPGVSAT